MQVKLPGFEKLELKFQFQESSSTRNENNWKYKDPDFAWSLSKHGLLLWENKHTFERQKRSNCSIVYIRIQCVITLSERKSWFWCCTEPFGKQNFHWSRTFHSEQHNWLKSTKLNQHKNRRGRYLMQNVNTDRSFLNVISTMGRFIRIQTDFRDFSFWSSSKALNRCRFVSWFSVRHCLFGLSYFGTGIKTLSPEFSAKLEVLETCLRQTRAGILNRRFLSLFLVDNDLQASIQTENKDHEHKPHTRQETTGVCVCVCSRWTYIHWR